MERLNDKQQKLITALIEMWKEYPAERFGQLLFNRTRIGTRVEVGTVVDPFHYLDEDILKDLGGK